MWQKLEKLLDYRSGDLMVEGQFLAIVRIAKRENRLVASITVIHAIYVIYIVHIHQEKNGERSAL